MSKYAGTLLITDEEGNSVFERELTSDEMIDEILSRPRIPEVSSGPITVTQENVGAVFNKERFKEGMKKAAKGRLNSPDKGRRVVHCSVCSKEGHSVRTCPDNKPENYGMDNEVPHTPRGEPKPCCGSRSAKHMKGCEVSPSTRWDPEKQGTAALPKVPVEKEAMLSETLFDMVKDAKVNDFRFNALQFANEHSAPLQQVNYAILHPTYEAYQKHFEYQNT